MSEVGRGSLAPELASGNAAVIDNDDGDASIDLSSCVDEDVSEDVPTAGKAFCPRLFEEGVEGGGGELGLGCLGFLPLFFGTSFTLSDAVGGA